MTPPDPDRISPPREWNSLPVGVDRPLFLWDYFHLGARVNIIKEVLDLFYLRD